ncbi:MAG: aminotransferase class V-fold PLP-dependent enzyme [Planctomycetaceae bacterium]
MIEPVLTISPTVESDPWQWWRQRMPIANKWAYFDHAAVAPLPRPAADAIIGFAQEAMQEGDTRWPEWAAENERLRDDFAAWLHCKPSEIALIPNTSYGINVIAEGIDWRPGDNIVLPAGEFPSNRFPWLNQRRHGVEVRIVGDDTNQVDLEALLAVIDDRTRVVAASWVGYASGYRLDVDRAVNEVHRRGALFFLDAIQGLGAFPLDLEKTDVDFLAADGHKWLLGLEGAGVLMVRESHLAKLACVPVGWNSVRGAHQFGSADFELRDSAARYEIGSQTMVGMHALRQSLAIFLQIRAVHGPEAIGNRILDQADKLVAGLHELGATVAGPAGRQRRSGIVTFSIPDVEPATIRRIALEQQVVVSCRGIGVRASVHAYNDDHDLRQLLDAVRSAMQRPPSTPHAI